MSTLVTAKVSADFILVNVESVLWRSVEISFLLSATKKSDDARISHGRVQRFEIP